MLLTQNHSTKRIAASLTASRRILSPATTTSRASIHPGLIVKGFSSGSSHCKSPKISPKDSYSHTELKPESLQSAYPDFSLQNKVYIVTGGGRGLGLSLVKAMAHAGAEVHCIDRLAAPHPDFLTAAANMGQGAMNYHCLDIQDTEKLRNTFSGIADQANRLDGLVAAAGVQNVKDAIDYTAADVADVMRINFTGVLMSASMVAREMMARKCHGSMVLVASMSGMVANKSLRCAAYNGSKAAVMQLARSLAMEWGPTGIRVNSLCPGHILTPMLLENFEQIPGLREVCEKENMLGRLATPEEFTGATIFLLSSASSFMTGSQLVIDGGHTAW